MRIYEATNRGLDIARDSGLEDLAKHIYETDYGNPILTQLTEDHPFNFDGNEPQRLEDIAIQKSYAGFKTEEERMAFGRALCIDPELDYWQQLGGTLEGTLFPLSEMRPFAKASPEDRLVVSGLVGLQLTKFAARCHLLAETRYKEYGFGTFSESCAFAGAYIVGSLIDKDQFRLFERVPSFSYDEDGVKHSISVGGTFHGDFIITEDTAMKENAVTPSHRLAEYGPRQSLTVSGYHSVEPLVVEAMLEQVYMTEGRQATKELIDEFIELIAPLVDSDGKVGFTLGNFADYGDGDVGSGLIGLRLLTEEDGDYRTILSDKETLFSMPYLPQSDTEFEIVSVSDGIRLQNGNQCMSYQSAGITINRDHYGDLLSGLLGQAQKGLGRTSPHQLIELVILAKDLLGA
jgi:hypothetical protein